jgi:hypothetical protein
MHMSEEDVSYILVRFNYFGDLIGIIQQSDTIQTGNPDIKRGVVQEQVYKSLL